MANKSITDLRKRISEVESRLRSERKELQETLRSTPTLVKSTIASRRGIAPAFLAAALVGAAVAMCLRPRPRKAYERAAHQR